MDDSRTYRVAVHFARLQHERNRPRLASAGVDEPAFDDQPELMRDVQIARAHEAIEDMAQALASVPEEGSV